MVLRVPMRHPRERTSVSPVHAGSISSASLVESPPFVLPFAQCILGIDVAQQVGVLE